MDRFKRFVINFATKSWVIFIILFLAGLAAYWTALDGKFLYDDTWLVGGNPFFKSPVFVFEVFRHYLFLDSLSFYYRPVQNISYMLDYWLWFSAPFGYHLSNICYHVLTAFLLYLLLKALLPRLAGAADWQETEVPSPLNALLAFLVALVWVVHPIHNAAVAYVSGRADSLACMFAITAWLLYIRATASRKTWVKATLQSLAMALLVLGLCSKEIASLWMMVFVFHLFVFNKEKSLRQKAGATLALLLVLVTWLFLRHLPGPNPGPSGGDDPRTPAMRFILMLRALGDYTTLIFWPSNLHMDRIVFTTNAYTSLAAWENAIRFEYLSIIGMAMIAIFILMGRSKLPGQRLRIFSLGWFVLGFLPISNLFPLNAQVAEHWIYMPSMGLLLFFAGCVLALPKKYHAWAAYVAVLAVIPFTLRTSERAAEWADPERFYRQTIQAGGGTTRINLNLAMIYFNKKDYPTAEAMMRDIVNRFPDYVPAKLNLGMVLIHEGKEKEAEQYLKYDKQATADISKSFVHTYSGAISMAGLRLKEGNYDEALAVIDDAIKQYPGVWDVVQFKANILQSMGRVPDAIVCMKAYTDAHWWQYQSFINLGQLYRLNGDGSNAIAAYQHAASLDIHSGEPYFRIAEIDENLLHQPDAAREARITGLTRNPEISKILSDLDREKQDAAEAIGSAGEVRQSGTMPGESD